eukprot:9593057-Karenia_brevis.AAC.1
MRTGAHPRPPRPAAKSHPTQGASTAGIPTGPEESTNPGPSYEDQAVNEGGSGNATPGNPGASASSTGASSSSS